MVHERPVTQQEQKVSRKGAFLVLSCPLQP